MRVALTTLLLAVPAIGGYALGTEAGGRVIRVSAANTAAPRDGRSWETALRRIHDALAVAKPGDEVWLAKGTYLTSKTGNRSESFRLKPGVSVFGGFAGTETEREQRDWRKNPTILSGDIGRRGDPSDNAYHVVVGATGAVLDGVVIAGGNANGRRPRGRRPGSIHISPRIVLSGPSDNVGGGMLNYQCAPIVRNCIFRNNTAGKGGAVYNMVARDFGPPRRRPDPAPTFENCRFENNTSHGRGGAVANDLRTHPTFVRCQFIGNSTGGKGGAVYNDFGCSPTFTNCLFVGNAAFGGGAIANDGGSSPLINCCTFWGNRAEDLGGALYQGTGPANNPLVIRSILWGDICPAGQAEIYNWHHCSPKVSRSCVKGGYPGEGNLDADPRFVSPEEGNFALAPDSPCRGMGHTAEAESVGRPEPPRLGPPPRRPRRPEPPKRLPRQAVVHVAPNAVGLGDGKSWETAYRDLQRAIDHAWASRAEVWVAAGDYKPSGNGRQSAFHLRPGVAVFGGFGGTETRRDQRDPDRHPTILSGDIGKPNDPSDNSYHVVVGADGARLDGFVIEAGNADGEGFNGKGGGMVNYSGAPQRGPFAPRSGFSPTVANCLFRRNRAKEGGAVYNFDRCSPLFRNCRFEQNQADFGGAVVDRVGVSSEVSDCVFRRNKARWRGGAYYVDYGSRPRLARCTFEANTSGAHGGALYAISRASQLEHSVVSLDGCSFAANTARFLGGAIALADSAIGELARCIFQNNRAQAGGAIALRYRATAEAHTCRFQDNVASDRGMDVETDTTSRFRRSR